MSRILTELGEVARRQCKELKGQKYRSSEKLKSKIEEVVDVFEEIFSDKIEFR